MGAQTTIDSDVVSLIKKKRSHNKEKGYGYRIQLFYGTETKARTELKAFSIAHPEIKTYIDYSNPPYWKSLVGDYKTRLEADKILNTIKTKFPSAIVVPR
tara:strand:- start:396 stop:695 length:300 start_codon:yes stop_codon:yes gene_type:complete